MFGAFGKLIGTIVLLVGVLGVLAGPLAMGYALQEQKKNDAGALGDDPQQTEENGQVALAGLAAAVAGVLLMAFGLLVVGASAVGRDRTLQRRTLARPEDAA